VIAYYPLASNVSHVAVRRTMRHAGDKECKILYRSVIRALVGTPHLYYRDLKRSRSDGRKLLTPWHLVAFEETIAGFRPKSRYDIFVDRL